MLTFAITFHNESKNLRGWFENIKHYTDDIVCTNQESTDDSKSIALSYGARVFDTKKTGYCETDRQRLLDEAKNDWVFIMDADERIPYDIDFSKLLHGSSKAFRTRLFVTDIGRVVCPIPGDYQIRLLPKATQWPATLHQKPSISYEMTDIPLYHIKSIADIRSATERYGHLSPQAKKDAEWYLNEIIKCQK